MGKKKSNRDQYSNYSNSNISNYDNSYTASPQSKIVITVYKLQNGKYEVSVLLVHVYLCVCCAHMALPN